MRSRGPRHGRLFTFFSPVLPAAAAASCGAPAHSDKGPFGAETFPAELAPSEQTKGEEQQQLAQQQQLAALQQLAQQQQLAAADCN